MTSPTARAPHPRDALFDSDEPQRRLPVCDHYAGVEPRMRKSLELQRELGPVFDVTLDCEDGAPVGGELEHAQQVAELVDSSENAHDRVGVRLPLHTHPRHGEVLETILRRAGQRVAYLMLPKPRDAADLRRAIDAVDAAAARLGLARQIPLHALVETPGAVREVDAMAAHPRIESLSFGLMDYVSAHRGAIPLSAMSVAGQFEHPLVLRAKLEIAAACHVHGKTPSHCVVTEFKKVDALQQAARQAAQSLGYTRMWSIHPAQVPAIVEAFAPSAAEVDLAVEVLNAAQDAHWGPIRHRDTLHDRASFRYFWYLLDTAHRTGQPLPVDVRQRYFDTAG